MTVSADGDLVVGGAFFTAGGATSADAARLVTDCPAGVQPVGTSCVGPGGPLVLTADGLPWAGGVFRTTITGFGPSSIGVAMIGFTPFAPGVVPLSSLPLVAPGVGCDLLQSGDIQETVLPAIPVDGHATYAVPLAAVLEASLPGLVFHLQVMELDGSGPGWIGTYTSNALACEVGAL